MIPGVVSLGSPSPSPLVTHISACCSACTWVYSVPAVALIAAAQRPQAIHALVSRGGLTDLAGQAIALVRAPTLQIAGGEDIAVLRLNWQVSARLQCEQRLHVVAGATHLFVEPAPLKRWPGWRPTGFNVIWPVVAGIRRGCHLCASSSSCGARRAGRSRGRPSAELASLVAFFNPPTTRQRQAL